MFSHLLFVFLSLVFYSMYTHLYVSGHKNFIIYDVKLIMALKYGSYSDEVFKYHFYTTELANFVREIKKVVAW